MENHTQVPEVEEPDGSDTGDVVTGEIRSAHLREPADAQRREADLDALTKIEADPEPLVIDSA